MCGRYRLRRSREQDLQVFLRLVIEKVDIEELQAGSDEAFPRNRMPIVRLDDDGGHLVSELRQWGFIMMMKGKSLDADGRRKAIRRDVFNAMSEKLTSGFPWRFVFAKHRCLIPMTSWGESPETAAGKQRVRVSMPSEPAFAAAGLYDLNTDPKTGDKVPVFTMCTVPPDEFLGTVYVRAPMVVQPSQYEAWLAGGTEALQLVGTHPDAGAFEVATA